MGLYAIGDLHLHFQAELKNQSQMLLGLGHDRIIYLGTKYIEDGYVTEDEFENLNKYLYEPYKALGGNGTAEKIMDDVRNLPIRKNKRKDGSK